MSILTYAGIRLPYCRTTNFSQEAVYDESNTDRIYTRFDITVQAVINADYLGLLGDHLTSITGQPVTKATTDNAAAIMQGIRQRLLQQRQALSFTFNGQELITQPQVGLTGTVDARNGPLPQFCNIFQLTNVTFLISYRIISHVWENPRTDAAGNVIIPGSLNDIGNTVLTNRWSETAIIDGLNQTTFRRSGKYLIRSDSFEGLVADELRIQMAVLAPYDGFLRQRSEYRVDPSGLAIEYIIEDKEQYKMPPAGAFTAEGEYTESGTIQGLAIRYGTARVKLQGDNNTNQAKLLDTAIDIVTAKLLARGRDLRGLPALFSKIGTLMDASARIDMYRNEVEFSARVWFEADPGRVVTLASFAGTTSTVTPLSDGVGSTTPNYLPYGTAGILIEAAAFFDPNLTDTQLRFDGSLSNGSLPGTTGRNPEA